MAGTHNPLAALLMRLQGVELGRGAHLCGFPVCVRTRGSRIAIGAGCTLNSAFLSNLAGLYQRCVLVARDGAELVVGDGTGMSGATVYAKESVRIGSRCLIGANAKIFDTDFHPVDPEERLASPNAGRHDPVRIGDNVFIGANSIVLKGVTIGDNSVVAAGSVVVKDVPANSLAGGNPARVIRGL